LNRRKRTGHTVRGGSKFGDAGEKDAAECQEGRACGGFGWAEGQTEKDPKSKKKRSRHNAIDPTKGLERQLEAIHKGTGQ